MPESKRRPFSEHPTDDTQCPKCGEWAGWDGPRYRDPSWGMDPYMRWVCMNCGYEIQTRTRDEDDDA